MNWSRPKPLVLDQSPKWFEWFPNHFGSIEGQGISCWLHSQGDLYKSKYICLKIGTMEVPILLSKHYDYFRIQKLKRYISIFIQLILRCFRECNMTIIATFLLAFHTKAWIFGAVYYWLTWIFIAIILGGTCFSLFQCTRRSRGIISSDPNEDEDELLNNES